MDPLGYEGGARRQPMHAHPNKPMTAADLPSPFAPGGASTAALLDAVGLVEMQRQFLGSHASRPGRQYPPHSGYMADEGMPEAEAAAAAGHRMASQEAYANMQGRCATLYPHAAQHGSAA